MFLASFVPRLHALGHRRSALVTAADGNHPDSTEHGECRYPYAHDFSGLPERTNAAAGLYAKACLEVARQCGLRAIDVWSRMQRFHGWEKSFLRYRTPHARTHCHVMSPPQCSIALQTPETTELKSNLAISCVVNCEGTGCT